MPENTSVSRSSTLKNHIVFKLLINLDSKNLLLSHSNRWYGGHPEIPKKISFSKHQVFFSFPLILTSSSRQATNQNPSHVSQALSIDFEIFSCHAGSGFYGLWCCGGKFRLIFSVGHHWNWSKCIDQGRWFHALLLCTCSNKTGEFYILIIEFKQNWLQEDFRPSYMIQIWCSQQGWGDS